VGSAGGAQAIEQLVPQLLIGGAHHWPGRRGIGMQALRNLPAALSTQALPHLAHHRAKARRQMTHAIGAKQRSLEVSITGRKGCEAIDLRADGTDEEAGGRHRNSSASRTPTQCPHYIGESEPRYRSKPRQSRF